MTEAETRARQLCTMTHGNDSLWEMYLDDARREVLEVGAASMPVFVDQVVMPFGKHKGERLADIPTGYLKWLCENVDTNPALNDAIEIELDSR